MLKELLKEILMAELKGELEQPKPKKHLIGQAVIIRCKDAGVHYGILEDYEGRTVTLSKSRRMWQWKAASGHTLSGCAVNGIDNTNSKIAAEISTIVLPEACEIIECTEKAIATIGDADEYQPD